MWSEQNTYNDQVKYWLTVNENVMCRVHDIRVCLTLEHHVFYCIKTVTGHFLPWISWMPMPFYLNKILSDYYFFRRFWVCRACMRRHSLLFLLSILQLKLTSLICWHYRWIFCGVTAGSTLMWPRCIQSASKRRKTNQRSRLAEYIPRDESVTLTNRGTATPLVFPAH